MHCKLLVKRLLLEKLINKKNFLEKFFDDNLKKQII